MQSSVAALCTTARSCSASTIHMNVTCDPAVLLTGGASDRLIPQTPSLRKH